MLTARPRSLWTVSLKDNALSAIRLMAEKDIGLVVVTEDEAIAGVLSERDCVRRLVLVGKSPELTPVADIMVRDVVKVDLARTFADCLKLMHQHCIRHLPVVENDKPITVISIRDLLAEAVQHHAKVIDELERERLTMLVSTA